MYSFETLSTNTYKKRNHEIEQIKYVASYKQLDLYRFKYICSDLCMLIFIFCPNRIIHY